MGFRFNKKTTPASPAASKAELFYSSSLTPNALAAVDESGNIARVAGFTTKDYRLIKVVVVAASGTYTPTSGAQALFVEAIGGGGAGGGGVTGTTATSAGSGGGGGAYSSLWVPPATFKASYSVAVGAAGTPGAAGNNPGGVGGDTTFDSPSICTAKGGNGGAAGGVAATTSLLIAGAAGGAAASGVGDTKCAGMPGGPSIRMSATIAASGEGGGGGFNGGGGGLEVVAQGAGVAGTGIGSGGSGGLALNGGASVAGGAGAAGLLRIWEFA